MKLQEVLKRVSELYANDGNGRVLHGEVVRKLAANRRDIEDIFLNMLLEEYVDKFYAGESTIVQEEKIISYLRLQC